MTPCFALASEAYGEKFAARARRYVLIACVVLLQVTSGSEARRNPLAEIADNRGIGLQHVRLTDLLRVHRFVCDAIEERREGDRSGAAFACRRRGRSRPARTSYRTRGRRTRSSMRENLEIVEKKAVAAARDAFAGSIHTSSR